MSNTSHTKADAMHILIVSLRIVDTGAGAFYNTQDIGLGRALARRGHTVDIYDFIHENDERTETVEEGLTVHFLTSRMPGYHSMHSYDFIDSSADAVICFSDNQLGFARLLKRCERAGVLCLPYIGVLQSHSKHPLKKKIMDLFASNNRFYRKMPVLSKTPRLAEELLSIGAPDVTVAPVGLDEELLHKDAAGDDVSGGAGDFGSGKDGIEAKIQLRRELALPEEAPIVFYLARMTQEKRPLEMVDIFSHLHHHDSRYHLVAIGKGEMLDAFRERVAQKGLSDSVTCLPKVPNSEIWKYYGACDVMVNLNTEEIFGMAILEAMYYGCLVAARHAPGPDYIIEDGADGILCADNRDVVRAAAELADRPGTDEQIGRRRMIAKNARKKIKEQFMWDHTAELILAECERPNRQ